MERVRLVVVSVCLAALCGLAAEAQAQPDITGVSPSSGTTLGGTQVTISGTNLASPTAVTFDVTAAPVLFDPDDGTFLLVSAPLHAAGQVNVVVTTAQGTYTEVNGFTYVQADGPAPTVTSVTAPAKGTTLGGTAITINGTDFRADATVKVGNVEATNVQVVNATTITAVTPAGQGGLSGAVEVTVTNSDTTFGTLANGFTYSSICDTDIFVGCISALTVNNADVRGTNIAVEMFPTGTAVQFSIVNTDNADRFELHPAVTVNDVIRLVFKAAPSFDPVAALSTGKIQGQGFQWDPATDTATLTLQPAASSWSVQGCEPGNCALQSTTDYTALALVVLDPLPGVDAATRAARQGEFMTTNGQFFSTPTSDLSFGGFTFQVGSPSLPASDDGIDDPNTFNDNNVGSVRFLVTNDFALNVWGIDPLTLWDDPADPNDNNDEANSQVTIGGQIVTPTISPVAATSTSPAGVLFEFEGFHYSIEDVAIVIAPTVSSINPTSGTTAGGTAVTITGLNFRANATVNIGGVAATSVNVVNDTTITAVTGAHAAGVVDVVVTNSDATTDTLAGAFTYVSPLALTSINPASGPTAGGTTVTLTGTAFADGATVTFGGTAASSVTFVNSTTLTAVTPARAAGAVDVVVTNSDATNATLPGAFTYIAPPTISSISPTSGKTGGGTAVTITGTGFLAGATVTIGGVAATGVTVVDPATITAVTGGPAAAGIVNVVVTNTDTQSATLTGGFTYVTPPTVTGVAPTQGPEAGGTSVTITGTGFTGGMTVTFGGTAGTVIGTDGSGTQLFATTPAHAPGAVQVVVGTSDATGALANAFTYVAAAGPAPTIASVAPTAGSTVGGTTITITGTGFLAGATVTVGGQAATGVSVVSGTSITAVTPAGSAGSVPVTVQNTDLQSATLANGFTYDAFCGAVVTVDCISVFQVNGAAPPSGISAEVLLNEGSVQVSVTNSASADRFELASTLSASDLLTVGVKPRTGLDPVAALSTGLVQNWQWNATTREATMNVNPRSSSWSAAGCSLPPGTCPGQATVDYSALALLLFDSVPAETDPPDPTFTLFRTNVQGAYIATNAQTFSTPSYDSTNDALLIDVGAPSLQAGGSANRGFVRIFVPYTFVTAVWGVADPTTIGLASSLVQIGGVVVTPTIAHLPASATGPAGILYEVADFGYSTPRISVRTINPNDPLMAIDTPGTGQHLGQPFMLAGWAIDRGALTGAGVDAIHVYAYPNPGSGTPPVFVGVGTYGGERPDVGALFGGRFADAGFSLEVRGLAPGVYQLVAFARSTNTTTFNNTQSVTVTVSASLQMSLDLPGAGVVAQPFRVAGWALDRAAASGTGVDAVHVWALSAADGAATFLGAAALGGSRPDVAAIFGSQFAGAGFNLVANGLADGTYDIRAFAHSAVTGAFSQVRSVRVTVASGVRFHIDLPRPAATIGSSFLVAGWALDLGATSGAGIAAVHVYAYPAGGGGPTFLGTATLGGARPDVAAAFGSQFGTAGFGLVAGGLAPGTYDIAVFPLSAVTGTFHPAKVVRVFVP